MNQLSNVVEMEMSVLSGLNVIEDESEYVFIQDDDMEFDEESYDHCDLSPDLSCAASVCSGVTLNDFKEEGIGSSMVSLEDRNDGETKDGVMKDGDVIDAMNAPGRRLCNKKRRKKLKMLKKAAAAAHFEASRKAQEESPTPERSGLERGSRSKSRGAKTKSKSGVNLAVACAHESIAAYREEVGGKQKKSSIVNYVL
jgi:hypothetical protein